MRAQTWVMSSSFRADVHNELNRFIFFRSRVAKTRLKVSIASNETRLQVGIALTNRITDRFTNQFIFYDPEKKNTHCARPFSSHMEKRNG